MAYLNIAILLIIANFITATKSWATQSYKTEAFTNPVFNVTKSGAPLAPGLILLTPNGGDFSAAQIFTDSGDLIWSSSRVNAFDLKIQRLDHEDVLLYWNGTGSPGGINFAGHGAGRVEILSSTYENLYTVCPHLGLAFVGNATATCEADIHEAFVTDKGSILVTAYNVTTASLAGVPGANASHFPNDIGYVFDSLFYEIDIKSGRILFRWSALEAGIKPSESFLPFNTGSSGSAASPYDFFHINSIQPLHDGYLINSRHLWTVFKIGLDGTIEWRFQGNDGGDFSLPANIHFAWEHDTRVQHVTNTGLILHFFDNANEENPFNGVNQSLGLKFALDLTNKKSELLLKLSDPHERLYAESQGSYQPLINGNVLLGYGQIPVAKEYGPGGDLRMTIQFGDLNGPVDSYRAFRKEWHANPKTDPKLVVEKGTAYFSWNGATSVTNWIVYEGKSKSSLTRTKRVRKQGFETNTTLEQETLYVQVAAFDGSRFLKKSGIVAI